MTPEKLEELRKKKKSVTIKPGVDRVKYMPGLRGRSQPASWVAAMPFRMVMEILPDIIQYVPQAKKTKEKSSNVK